MWTNCLNPRSNKCINFHVFNYRYCLFGLNVGLTEKFESNSQPMKIHVSEACKNQLSAQYKFELREDEEVKAKVGGLNSYFLTSKDGRQPMKEATIKALLPTSLEKPKYEGADKDKKKKEDKKADAPAAKADAPAAPAAKADAPAAAAAAPAAKAAAAPAPAAAAAPAPAAASAPSAPAPAAPTASAPAASAPDAPEASEPEAESAPAEPSEDAQPEQVCLFVMSILVLKVKPILKQ
jgi:hypothetical protein